MKKSLIENTVKFIQNPNGMNHSVNAPFTQCIGSSGNAGGGALI